MGMQFLFNFWVQRRLTARVHSIHPNQSTTSRSESSVFRHCLHPIFPGSGDPFDGRTTLDGHRCDEDEAPAGEARFGELLVIARIIGCIENPHLPFTGRPVGGLLCPESSHFRRAWRRSCNQSLSQTVSANLLPDRASAA